MRNAKEAAMNNMRTLCTLIILALFLIISLPLLAETYTNPDYGFEAKIDQQLKICTTPPPGSNHGFVVLLQTNSCETDPKTSRIEVFVYANVVSEAKTTKALTEEACGKPQAIKTRIISAGVPVYKCKPKIVDALTQWRYFFLRPTPSEWVGDWIIFYVDLYTTKESAKHDLNILRRLFQNIHWIGFKHSAKE